MILAALEESNALFGVRRIWKVPNVSPDTTGTFDFPVLTGAKDVFGRLRHLD
jgi:hypothetical protein